MSAPSLASLAAFDVDHTLTRRDCVLPFLRRVAGDWAVLQAGARHLPILTQVALRRADRDVAKAALLGSIFAGRAAGDIAAKGRAHAHDTYANWMRPDTLARLRWHQSQGHPTALVSASLGAYLHPLGELLGVDHVFCTELEHDDQTGALTGRMLGRNCRGPEKVARLEMFLGRPEAVWAYGDSAGDTEMLAWADHAYLIRKNVTISIQPEAST